MTLFNCKKCKSLEEEVKHLRETNARLTDRIMALADARAYAVVSSPKIVSGDYYGSEDDEMIDYNEFGERIVLKKVE